MKKKRFASVLLLTLAGLVLLMGIWQLLLFVPPQMEMLADAASQGATDEQISDYCWQQLLPDLLGYLMTALSLPGVLFAAGVLLWRTGAGRAPVEEVFSAPPPHPGRADVWDSQGTDNFFEDFEALDEDEADEGGAQNKEDR